MPEDRRARRPCPRPEPAHAEVEGSTEASGNFETQGRDGRRGNRPPGSPVPVADRRGAVPQGERGFVGSVVFIRQERSNIRPLASRARPGASDSRRKQKSKGGSVDNGSV